MKSTWRVINNILGEGKKADLPDNCHDDQRVYSEPSDIANAFNSYFTIHLLTTFLQLTLTSWITYTTLTPHLYFLYQLTHLKYYKLVISSRSDTSCGFDDIRSSVVKSVISFISHPLAYIFNISLLTGSVPLNLKIAKVTTVFKNGEPNEIYNYRPISVLPCFSKILERLVYNRLSKFLSNFNIFFDHQFGFRSKHSTDIVLIHLTDLISSSLCDKVYTASVFLDTIDHSILLSKLSFYWIMGCAIQWFKDVNPL